MSPREAFIDIGTNTILCLIAELRDGGRFRVLEDLAEIPRLGEGVDRTRRIGREGEERSYAVLERYLRRCRELGVERICTVGTSALRDARNGAAVCRRFRERLGLEVRVISGEEEAAYAFLAVHRGLGLRRGELWVVDIGGGSTEFVRGEPGGTVEARSVNLGSVRITERFLRSDPVTEAEIRLAVAAIDGAIASTCEPLRAAAGARTMVGIAGTFTTLAAVARGLRRYSHEAVHGESLGLAEVRRQARLYGERSIAERKRIVGLDPRRADVILAGTLLVERIMTLSGIERVIVSDQGLRYGLLYERLGVSFRC
ncbi:MAG TPA: Ppx/GppA phosphatase family protein [candidate division Zixibacteria bacterium]|nr:Ppx/GppA phosphatase family protein [candidate division Zixibacteria bacterium]